MLYEALGVWKAIDAIKGRAMKDPTLLETALSYVCCCISVLFIVVRVITLMGEVKWYVIRITNKRVSAC